MAYILTPRFAPGFQDLQCNPFGFCSPSSQPIYRHHMVQRSQPLPQPHQSPYASFFSQLDEIVDELEGESQRQAQIERQREAKRAAHIEAQRVAHIKAQREAHIRAQREAHIKAEREAHIKAQREAYQAHIEAEQAAYRQRQAQIEAHIEAQREVYRQHLLQKPALRAGADFAITQSEEGWQVDGEVHGFEQENISIEVTDENTLKIAGNTEWGAKHQTEAQPESEAASSTGKYVEETSELEAAENMEGISLDTAVDTAATATETIETGSGRPVTPDSDTASQRSYQATVEDDFEDLGPEASKLFSQPSAPTTPTEAKGKEKAVDSSIEHREIVKDLGAAIPTEATITQQRLPEVPAQQHQERLRESFERTLMFPARIDAGNVRASLKGGVLSISVPRAPAQEVKRIAIL